MADQLDAFALEDSSSVITAPSVVGTQQAMNTPTVVNGDAGGISDLTFGGDETLPDETTTPKDEESADQNTTADDQPTADEQETEGPAPDQEPADDAVDFTPFIESYLEEVGEEFDPESVKDLDLSSVSGFNQWIDKRIEERSQPRYSNEDEAQFADFLASGGNVQDYFQAFYAQEDYSQVEMKTDTMREQVYKNYLKESTRFSDEKIAKMVEFSKEAGDLEDDSTQALDWLKENQSEQQKQTIEQAKQQKQAALQQQQEQVERIKKDVQTAEQIAGFTLNKADKDRFIAYTTERDKEGYTAYAREIGSNADLQMALAMLAFQGVHKGKIDVNQPKNVTKKVQNTLRNFTSQKPNRTKEVSAKKVNTDFAEWSFN